MYKSIVERIKKIIKKHRCAAGSCTLDKGIFSIIYLIFFLTPVFFTGLSMQGAGFDKMMLFFSLTIVATILFFLKKIFERGSIMRTSLDWPILFFLVSYVLSVIFSINPLQSLLGTYGNSARSLMAVLTFAVFFYLVANTISLPRLKLLFWALISSAGIVIAISVLQFAEIFILPFEISKFKDFNLIGSNLNLNFFLIAILPLFITAISHTKSFLLKATDLKVKIIKSVLSALALVDVVLLSLMHDFTFWPAAIVGAVIILIYFFTQIVKAEKTNMLPPLVAFFVLTILMILSSFNTVDLQLMSESRISRSVSWDIAKDSIKTDPLLGTGPSQFFYNFAKYKDFEFNNTAEWNVRFDSASGALFELLATTGGLGALAFLILTLILFSEFFTSINKTKSEAIKPVLLALSASFTSMVILGALFPFNSSFLIISVLITSLGAGAIFVAMPDEQKKIKLDNLFNAKYSLAMGVVFAILLVGASTLLVMAEKKYRADVFARKSATTQDMTIAEQNLKYAIELNPYEDIYELNLSKYYIGTAANALAGQGDETRFKENLDLAILHAKRGYELAPEKVFHSESLGNIYEVASYKYPEMLQESEKMYNNVSNLEPANPNPFLRLAVINSSLAQSESGNQELLNKALENYDEVVKRKPDVISAYQGKAQIYYMMGDLDGAIVQTEKAFEMSDAAAKPALQLEIVQLYLMRGSMGQEEEKTLQRNEYFDTAEAILGQIIESNGNDISALYIMATMYQKLGEDDKAKIYAQKVINLIPDEETKKQLTEQFKDALK